MNKTIFCIVICCFCIFTCKAKEPEKPKDGKVTDTRDGKIYKVVKIGEQVWMAENLNYKTENSLCYGENWEVRVDGKKSKLSDVEFQANCDKYGRLYDWEVAMNACPSGWHLPTNEEWGVLTKTVGGDTAGCIIGKWL